MASKKAGSIPPNMEMYNGRWVRFGWAAIVSEVQTIDQMFRVGRKKHTRIRYGEEADDYGADRGACGGCAVVKGQYHVPSCRLERCPCCGGQAMGCDNFPFSFEEE